MHIWNGCTNAFCMLNKGLPSILKAAWHGCPRSYLEPQADGGPPPTPLLRLSATETGCQQARRPSAPAPAPQQEEKLSGAIPKAASVSRFRLRAQVLGHQGSRLLPLAGRQAGQGPPLGLNLLSFDWASPGFLLPPATPQPSLPKAGLSG